MKSVNQTKLATKKILKAVKKSQKSGWFPYLLDTLAVIVGILTAFALNNWKERITENKQEQEILKTIQAEFLYNQSELNRNVIKAKRLHARADTIVALFNLSKAEIVKHNTDSLLRGLSGYSSFDPSNGALNDLIGSGRLGIIKNDSLRNRLSKWSSELQDVKEDEVRLMNFGDEFITPVCLRYYTLNRNSKFSSTSHLLFDNLEFENTIIRFRSAVAYIIEDNYSMLDTEIDAILRLIDNEIEK